MFMQLAPVSNWFLLDKKKRLKQFAERCVYVGTNVFPPGVFKMHLFLNALVGWHRGKCHSRVTFDKWSPADGKESIKGGAFERSAFVFNWYCVNPTVSVSKPGATETHGCQTPSALSSCGAERRVPASPRITPNPLQMQHASVHAWMWALNIEERCCRLIWWFFGGLNFGWI